MIFHAYENGFQTLGRQTLLRELVQKEVGNLENIIPAVIKALREKKGDTNAV